MAARVPREELQTVRLRLANIRIFESNALELAGIAFPRQPPAAAGRHRSQLVDNSQDLSFLAFPGKSPMLGFFMKSRPLDGIDPLTFTLIGSEETMTWEPSLADNHTD